MKNCVLVTAIALALILPATAWSQTTPPPNGNSGPPGNNMMMQHNQNGASGTQGDDHEHFQEHKQEILRHMNEHLAEVQKRMACVQAANDHEALRACMPERREGHGGMQGGHGEGGERGGEHGDEQGGER